MSNQQRDSRSDRDLRGDRHRSYSNRQHRGAESSSTRVYYTSSNQPHSRSRPGGGEEPAGTRKEGRAEARSTGRRDHKESSTTNNIAPNNNSHNNSSRSSSTSAVGYSEVRISRLSKLLGMEESRKEFISLCSQIEDLILIDDNQVYIQKSFSKLAYDYEQIFFGLTNSPWKSVGIKRYAEFLNKLLDGMSTHCLKMIKWMIDLTHEKAFVSECLFVFEAVVLEVRKRRNIDEIDEMIPQMKRKQLGMLTTCIVKVLENADSPEVFKVLSGICASSILSNRDSDMTSFMDFVDVVIGWMLSDTEEYYEPIPTFCSHILRLLSDYFKKDLVFASSMLSQLLDDFHEVGNGLKLDAEATGRILNQLKATLTLMSLGCTFEKAFITSAFENLVQTTLQILKNKKVGEKFKLDLLIAANECLASGKTDGPQLRTFIKNQLDSFTTTRDWTNVPKSYIIVFLANLSNWIETTSSQAQLDSEAEKLFEESTKCLDILCPHLGPDDQLHVLKVIHSLLRTRNISCLQRSYSWLVGKLEPAEKHDFIDSKTVLFVLAGLTDIAGIKTGSILSQWALDPPIFDLLVELVKSQASSLHGSPVVGICALKLLRTHCEAHSHFVSSIASSKSYISEGAGTRSSRFLPSLMKFWLELLASPSQLHENEWLLDWIFSFIKTSAPFITILIESDKDFYVMLMSQLFQKSDLRKTLLRVIKWISEDQHYKQSDFIINIVRDTICKLLLLPNLSHQQKREASSILANLPPKITVDDENPALTPNLALGQPLFRSHRLPQFANITTYEFNEFLHNLLSHNSTQSYPWEVVSTSVEFLLQSKLKTTVGRPQDFFALLGTLLKRTRVQKLSFPQWKLDFIFHLERSMVNAIHGSTFIPCHLLPTVRSFYVTNKTSCMEGIKRIRSDLTEVSLSSGSYASAFRNASLSGDDLVAKFALLELEDSEGLKALSEVAGFYFLQNKLEKVLQFMPTTEAEADSLNTFEELILKRTEAILATATSSIETWDESPEDRTQFATLFTLKTSQSKTFLPLQMEVNKFKLDLANLVTLKEADSYEKLSFIEKIQIGEIVKNSPSFSTEFKQTIETAKLEEMMKFGNIEYIRNVLTVCDIEETISHVSSNVIIQANYFKNLADLFYAEENHERSAQLYISLLDMMEQNGTLIDCTFKGKFYISFASKLDSSTEFYDVALRASLLLSTLKDKASVLQSLYETAIHVRPHDPSVWFEYGNFAYSLAFASTSTPEDSKRMKKFAQHCYAKFFVMKEMGQVQWSGNRWKSMQLRTRLLSLHKSGFQFEPEEVLIHNEWLPLLPSLCRIKDLRQHLVRRFPEQASFLVAAYTKEKKYKRLEGRRGILDPLAYSFTEASEESFTAVCHCLHDGDDKGQSIAIDSSGLEDSIDSYTEPTLQGIDPNVYLFIEELERIGSLREELWSWSIERIISDSSKRLSALRRDMARDSNVLKVKAYISPLFAYLNELWNTTQQANTAAELAFLNKYGPRIEAFLKSLESCKSADDFSGAIDQIVSFGSSFESSFTSRLDLEAVSPKLASMEFSNSSSSTPTYIPGFPSSVALSRVHSVITCLQTKAKPKRLSFIATNGRVYDYLVKGNENLNIDSGVMQLLEIAQELVEVPVKGITYSITPFGERGGFIQIVESAQPVYLMYKKHLQRINCAERPTFTFWRLMNDLGHSDRSNVDGLKSVFEELVKETDADIISRELFLCADDPSCWLNAVRNFTRDAAIGATIGYLIGIGDRHLDNILLNPKTGRLIHVDFSLLFGRGTTLQVPEIVPFRLTQNISSCLQYPGTLGPFRCYMETFMDLFKLHKDAFLFGVEEIAYATMLEDSSIVNPTAIVKCELVSAVQLLRFRSKNIASTLQSLMIEVLDTIERKSSSFSWAARSDFFTTIDKLKKKLNRWRRLLANVDPLIQFIAKYAQPDNCELERFQQIVTTEWLPIVHFWCHSQMDVLLEQTSFFPDQLKLADDTLQVLLAHLPPSEKPIQPNPHMLTSKEAEIEFSRIQSKVTSTMEKFMKYDESTIGELIATSTNSENLCKMFEGWTPWV